MYLAVIGFNRKGQIELPCDTNQERIKKLLEAAYEVPCLNWFNKINMNVLDILFIIPLIGGQTYKKSK